jgi:aspartate carbamoyltransferase catalytic subunit
MQMTHPMPNMQHCLSTTDLSADDIYYLIERSNYFLKKAVLENKQLILHNGQTFTPLFFEPSTRTLNSFLLAAKRLGMITLNPNLSQSATQKGESLQDTIQTFEAMGTRVFALRHRDDYFTEQMAAIVNNSTHIVNAGNGMHQHPSQALLDIMTIQQNIKDWSKLRIAIVGDSKHSRVVGSLVPALQKMGVCDIRLIGPDGLVAKHLQSAQITTTTQLNQGVQDAHVIIALRIQKERLTQHESLNIEQYKQHFCITPQTLSHAHKQVIIMHPGPMNCGIEITESIAKADNARILQQVRNGVAMRMAILDTLLSG